MLAFRVDYSKGEFNGFGLAGVLRPGAELQLNGDRADTGTGTTPASA